MGHSHSVHMHGVSFFLILRDFEALEAGFAESRFDGYITVFVYWNSRKFCLGGKAGEFLVYTMVICLRTSTCLAQVDFSLVQGSQI